MSQYHFISANSTMKMVLWFCFIIAIPKNVIPIISLSVSWTVSPSRDLVETKLPSQFYGIQPFMVRWSQRYIVVPGAIIKDLYEIQRNDATQSFLSIFYVISPTIQQSKNHNHFFNTHNGVEMWMRWWLRDSIKSRKFTTMLAFDIECQFEKIIVFSFQFTCTFSE